MSNFILCADGRTRAPKKDYFGGLQRRKYASAHKHPGARNRVGKRAVLTKSNLCLEGDNGKFKVRKQSMY
jgi:hypothetical protein